jgi:hypothetical protein
MITTPVSVLISRLEDIDVILLEHTFAGSIESKALIEPHEKASREVLSHLTVRVQEKDSSF